MGKKAKRNKKPINKKNLKKINGGWYMPLQDNVSSGGGDLAPGGFSGGFGIETKMSL